MSCAIFMPSTKWMLEIKCRKDFLNVIISSHIIIYVFEQWTMDNKTKLRLFDSLNSGIVKLFIISIFVILFIKWLNSITAQKISICSLLKSTSWEPFPHSDSPVEM